MYCSGSRGAAAGWTARLAALIPIGVGSVTNRPLGALVGPVAPSGEFDFGRGRQRPSVLSGRRRSSA